MVIVLFIAFALALLGGCLAFGTYIARKQKRWIDTPTRIKRISSERL